MLAIGLSSTLYAITGWENPVNLSKVKRNLYCHNPAISSDNDMLAIAWEEKYRNSTTLNITYGSSLQNLDKKSLYNTGTIYNLQPDILVLFDIIVITYSNPDGEVYVIRGKEKGKFWSLPMRITFTPYISLEPKLYYDAEKKKLYLFYLEESKGIFYLRYTESVNNGASWSKPNTILNSEKTGIAIFFPSVFITDNKFYIIYQGRAIGTGTEEGFRTDKIFVSIIKTDTGEIIKNEELLSSTQFIRYMPVAKNYQSLIWREAEENIWNIYLGIIDESHNISPLKINIENKNSYNHTALFGKDYIKIFWSMVDQDNSQIFSRKFHFNYKKLGNEEKVIETKRNSYNPRAVFYQGAEYIVWQEEYDSKQSAILLQKQDVSAPAPVITKPGTSRWYNTTDINVSWTIPRDPSGIAGFGYVVTRNDQPPERIIQNIPGEVNTVNVKELLSEGTNYFYLKLYDKAGNESQIVSKMILVDQTGPRIDEITSPTHPPGEYILNTKALVNIKSSDNYHKVKGYAYIVDYGKESKLPKRIKSQRNVLNLKLNKGISYLKIAAVDELGNWGQIRSYPFYVTKRKGEELIALKNQSNENNVVKEEINKLEEDKKRQQEEEKLLALQKEAEKKKQEELARLEEEKKKREEIARIQDETKRQEELAKLEAEKKKQEELARLELEKKRQEE
ncbi:MAG: hypothetical protein JW827_01840, partial [Spirochaetes bacterium]|nr:hypothetical protein [Spirochaetota bacterium]